MQLRFEADKAPGVGSESKSADSRQGRPGQQLLRSYRAPIEWTVDQQQSAGELRARHRSHYYSQQHEVAVQRGAPLWEEEGRGGEDQEEVPGQSPCHRGEVTQSPYWRFGQEKVPGALWSHCRPVLLPHQEEDQSPPRGRALLLCQ